LLDLNEIQPDPEARPPLTDAEMAALTDEAEANGEGIAEPAPAVVNWRTMPPERVEAVWDELVEWVDWLIDRYSLTSSQIPDCWFQHGSLVEELSALHTFWLAAFDDTGSGGGPVMFHDRLLPTLARFRLYGVSACADATIGHYVVAGRVFRDHKATIEGWRESTHTYQVWAAPERQLRD
jgi:hypothetical protein